MKKINLADKAELMFDNEKLTDLYDRYVRNAVKDPISVRKKLEMRDVWYKPSDPETELMSMEGGVEFDVRLITLVCAVGGAIIFAKITKKLARCALMRERERVRKLEELREREKAAYRMKLAAKGGNA